MGVLNPLPCLQPVSASCVQSLRTRRMVWSPSGAMSTRATWSSTTTSPDLGRLPSWCEMCFAHLQPGTERTLDGRFGPVRQNIGDVGSCISADVEP